METVIFYNIHFLITVFLIYEIFFLILQYICGSEIFNYNKTVLRLQQLVNLNQNKNIIVTKKPQSLLSIFKKTQCTLQMNLKCNDKNIEMINIFINRIVVLSHSNERTLILYTVNNFNKIL